MEEDGTKPARPWREIAEEVSKENDSDKVAQLSNELIQALDKQNQRSEQSQKDDEPQVRRKAA